MTPGVFSPPVRFAQIYLIPLLLAFCACAASAQTQQQMLSEKIAQDRELIRSAERQQTSDTHQGYLWAVLADDYRHAADFLQSENAYNRSIRLLKAAPEARTNYATAIDNLGSLYLTYGHTGEAWSCMKKALAIRRQLDDQINIAMSLKHMADVDVVRHRYKDAEREASEAAQTLLAPGASYNSNAASLLVTLSYSRCKQNNCTQGLQDAERALVIARAAFQPDSLQIGLILVALGFAQWNTGQTQDAERSILHGIEIIKNQTAPGDPLVFYAMLGYRTYLVAMHRNPDVKQLDTQLADLRRPCPSCSVSVYSLSNATR